MKLNPVIGRRIALVYDSLREYNPQARPAWDAMAADELRQFRILERYILFLAWREPGVPYANSRAMRADVLQRRRLEVFDRVNDTHPCRTPAEVFRGRAVHDVCGHAVTSFDFSPTGELRAFRAHARMYSDEALPALACDNLGQTMYYFYHPVNDGKPHAARVWPVQKVDFLPEELWRPML